MANALDTFFIMVEPQEGGTYDEIMTLAQKAETLGFGGFFRSDHYMPVNANIPPRPSRRSAGRPWQGSHGTRSASAWAR